MRKVKLEKCGYLALTDKSKTNKQQGNKFQTEGTGVHRLPKGKEHNVLCTPRTDRRPV